MAIFGCRYQAWVLMRVLLSTIGSRGDVQPLVALAWAFRSLGQDVRLCVPPDFRGGIERLGMPVTPIGPELRSTGKADAAAARPTPEQRRRMIEDTVAAQFATIAAAAEGCDVMVGATALQIAAPVLAVSVVVTIVFAILSRAVPQMDVFVLSFSFRIIGGLAVSQVLTLYTTPVVYLFLDRLGTRLRGRPSSAPLRERNILEAE